MTNEQRKAAQDAATALKTKLTADKATVARLREMANALAAAALDMECCISSTIKRADDVIAQPLAGYIRELEGSKNHLALFGRRRLRKAYRAIGSVEATAIEGVLMREETSAQ